MACDCREPTLKEILSDSIVAAIMQADDVDPERLDAMLSMIASELAADGRGRPIADHEVQERARGGVLYSSR
ncbi:MAG: hypothetical protein ACRECO_20070 [Xanthobacteraceae bacterium]